MNDVIFLWDGWEPVARIALIGVVGYATLVVLLRVARQRTLARMTPFDFVITVTIGSAFGRVLTAQEVAASEVVTVFVVLVALQWIVVWLRARFPAFSRLITPAPSLVLHEGAPVADAMRRHRLTEHDLLTAAREQGLGSLDEAYAIVLEPDGTFAVISPSTAGDRSALRDVERR